ncbi:MAG: hypothetical protein ACTHM1_02050 [Solirubrobacteraceae bacterium]
MSLLSSIAAAGTRTALAPVRVPVAVLGAGRAIERRTRAELIAAFERALPDLVDNLSAQLLTDEIVDRALARVEQSGITQRIADRMLADGIAEQIAERALAGPELERMIAAAFRGPLVEEAVTQLLESQAVWVLVDEIAHSPSVTEAIAHQGSGFLDQVAARLRERSRRADSRVQELAHRVGHAPSEQALSETAPAPPRPLAPPGGVKPGRDGPPTIEPPGRLAGR